MSISRSATRGVPLDEDFDANMEEETKGEDSLTLSDEEFARQLQQELSGPTIVSESSSSVGSSGGSNRSDTKDYTKPTSSLRSNNSMGTYTTKSSGSSGRNNSTEVAHGSVYFEPEIVIPSEESANILDMQRRASTVKFLCGVDFFFSIYSLFYRSWYLSFGFLFDPLGFWGATRFNRNYVLFYLIYLVVDTILEIVYLSLNASNGLAVTLTLLLICIQLFTLYYTILFFKILPKVGQIHSEVDIPLHPIRTTV